MLSAPCAGTGGCRCLDAAHGAGRNPVASGKRMRNVRSEGKKTGMQVARNPRRRSPHVAAHADFRQGSRLTVAEARSRRCEAIARMNAAENANNGFTAIVNAVHLVRNVGRSLRGTLAGLRCGRLRPARLKEPNNGDSKSFARTGCDRPTLTTLLCHSERSEESFPLRTKGRLRTMPSKEEKDKRSAVKNLSTYTFIQILRRSSDLLRMTILPLHWSGIDFWSRPGRLRGSRFQREPAPGARSSVSERACGTCLP